MAYKCLDWFVMGLCFGMGFAISVAVLRFIAGLLSQGAGHSMGL